MVSAYFDTTIAKIDLSVASGEDHNWTIDPCFLQEQQTCTISQSHGLHCTR